MYNIDNTRKKYGRQLITKMNNKFKFHLELHHTKKYYLAQCVNKKKAKCKARFNVDLELEWTWGKPGVSTMGHCNDCLLD